MIPCMNKLKLISIFTAVILALAVVEELLVSKFFPAYFMGAQLYVPAYFWLFYTIVITAVNNSATNAAFAKFFMAVKGIKIILSLIVLFALSFIFRAQAAGIIMTFLVYYSLATLIESVYLLYTKRNTIKKT